MNEAQRAVFAHFPEQNPVLVHPGLAIVLESINASIMLCQLLYWHDKGKKKGWVYKTIDELKIETGLTRHQQDTAIGILEGFGFISHKRMGSHGKRHFKVSLSEIHNTLGLSENGKHQSDNAANTNAENRQTYTENTAENTPQTTKNIVSSNELTGVNPFQSLSDWSVGFENLLKTDDKRV